MKLNCESLQALIVIQEDPSEVPNCLHKLWVVGSGKWLVSSGVSPIHGIGASKGEYRFSLLLCKVDPLMGINFERGHPQLSF